jgi:FtsP/CotA-like multicopper oxidase with cupredoxin domain
MRRREFLKTTGLGAGSLLAGSSLVTFLTSCTKMGMMNGGDMNMMGQSQPVTEGAFNKLLSIPGTVTVNTTLNAQATTAIINGSMISVLGYQANGILGPTIRAESGLNTNIIFQNSLSENSNIHFHGLKIPVDMDGHPKDIINPGSNFNYKFTINQRAGLSWYHPHPDGDTASQVFKGLAGLFIINDAEEAALNLPSGSYEIPLVIQDKRLSSSGITYNPSMGEVMTGYMGETIIVNGVASPFAEVKTKYYRLRILNGSNARIYNLALSNNADIIIIGNDGGLLKNPVTVKNILLAPGERLDALVNFAGLNPGTEVFLQSSAFSNGGNAQGEQGFKILKFKVTQSESDTFILPAQLSSFDPINPSSSSRTRNFIINGMQMSGGMNMNMSGIHKINGKIYDRNRIDETVSANTTETWVFDNSQGNEPHPMHLHGVHFQVMERRGGRGQLIPSEGGSKDTVLVLPGETVKVLVPFAELKGVFVFHCHNLEHEDDGMMLQYQLV